MKIELDLSSYKGLTRKNKVLATKYFVAVIMQELNVEKVSEIYEALILKNEKDEIGANLAWLPKQEVKYWEKKYRTGEPIRIGDFLETIDEILPGITQYLNHPLWGVLDNLAMSQREIDSNILKLNGIYRKIFFEPQSVTNCNYRKKYYSTRDIKNIAKHNSLDGFACLLLLRMENRKTNTRKLTEVICEELFLLFFRLSSISPLTKVGYDIYTHLIIYFDAYHYQSIMELYKKHFESLIKGGTNTHTCIPTYTYNSDKWLEIYNRIVNFYKYIVTSSYDYFLIRGNQEYFLRILHESTQCGPKVIFENIKIKEAKIKKIFKVCKKTNAKYTIIYPTEPDNFLRPIVE